MDNKLYPHQVVYVDSRSEAEQLIGASLRAFANSHFGKVSINQQYGRMYRPNLWHLMSADPHDKFDNWVGNHTWFLTGDNDPCDEWEF